MVGLPDEPDGRRRRWPAPGSGAWRTSCSTPPTLRGPVPDAAPARRRGRARRAPAGFVEPGGDRRRAPVAGRAAPGPTCTHGETGARAGRRPVDGVRVVTDHGSYTAGRLVLAPGAWAPELLADLGSACSVERYVQFWFAPGDPAAFAGHPVYIWEDAGGRQVYGFGDRRTGRRPRRSRSSAAAQPCDPHTIDRSACTPTRSPRSPTFVRTAHARRCPAGSWRAKTCLYTLHPDEHFVIAPHPAHDDVVGGLRLLRARLQVRPGGRRDRRRPRRHGTTRHPIGLFDPRPAPDGARLGARRIPAACCPTLPGSYLHRSGHLRRRAGAHLRDQLVLRRRLVRRRDARRVPHRHGRAGERADHPVPRPARRARSSTCAATAARSCAPRTAGAVKRHLPLPVPRLGYDLDGKLAARAAPAEDAGHRPHRVRAAHGRTCASGSATSGSAWPATPPSVRGHVHGVGRRPGSATSPPSTATASTGLALGRRITYDVAANWKLVIENFMECYHCATIHPELTGVLPEFARAGRRSPSSATARDSGTGVEGFTVDGVRGARPPSPASTRTRTAATSR